MILSPATRLGPYEILESIGEGGMGEVYRAKDLKLGRDVAIKVLPSELASDPERLKRFEREARTASALNHPNIVTIHAIDEHEGTHYIAMELVKGKTLRELMGGGPLSMKKVLPVATQIAGGLSTAHAAGIVHRDLKPENVMVREDGLVKILDFGLAKLTLLSSGVDSQMATVTRATRAGVILGTVQYMSPEQAAGRPIDYRSDQFSFGSILYEMATGKLAFKRPTVPQTLAAIIEDEPEPMRKASEEIPGELAAVVERCLAKKAEGRYESTGDLAAELKTVPEKTSTVGPRPTAEAAAPIVESIAVLPLRNLSGDPGQEYLADGITESLIIDLAKIGALKVISRTSVMGYKGTDKPLPKIARELNIDAVVEGSAVRVGDRVRITAQLIHAETDRLMWAESYERDFQDLLLVQSEVARAIAGEIQVALTPEETKRLAGARQINPEAYEAYLKGRFHLHKITPEHVDTAQKYFQLALEKDPGNALAHAGIAYVWLTRADWGVVPPREAVPKAKAAVLKALELDDTLADAHMLLAFTKYSYEWDWSAAERAFQRAIDLNPNYSDVRVFYSHFLICMKRPEEAQAQMAKALELDPLYAFSQGMFGMSLFYLHRYDDAIAELRKTLRMEPDYSLAHQFLWFAFPQKQMFDEALEEAKRYFAVMGDGKVAEVLAGGYAEAGYAGAMRLAAEKLAARAKQSYVSAMDIAYLYGHAGEEDRALEWLERCYEERELDMVSLGVNSIWDSLRDDPRFQDLLRRMNLPQ